MLGFFDIHLFKLCCFVIYYRFGLYMKGNLAACRALFVPLVAAVPQTIRQIFVL